MAVADDSRAILIAFMRRAERIMSTSAAQREDLATAGSTINILVRVGQQQHRIERTHLPVDELLAAAAVIRPVTSEKEPVFPGKVISAISHLVQDAPDPVRARVREVRKGWQKFLAAERWILMVMKSGESAQTRLTDVEIAELYFNAYVWHDDVDKQWALRQVSDDDCLIAASVWVSDRVLFVRAVQQMIVDLRKAAYLPG